MINCKETTQPCYESGCNNTGYVRFHLDGKSILVCPDHFCSIYLPKWEKIHAANEKYEKEPV